jgi:hypothetical protein
MTVVTFDRIRHPELGASLKPRPALVALEVHTTWVHQAALVRPQKGLDPPTSWVGTKRS